MLKKITFCIITCIVFFLLLREKNSFSTSEIVSKKNPKLTKVINVANSFKGTPYLFGGTTKKGMDCSGLVFTSFKAVDINLARSSKNMYYEGEEVALKDVKKGDLLFFDIDKFQGRINHVGLVTSVDSGEVDFVHSTTSKGVIITSINESYWKKAFFKAKRIIN